MKIDYIKIKKPLVRWLPGVRWNSNFQEIELEITTFCNLKCYNCDRSIRQAPSVECMSLSQIQKFVRESINLKWKWNQITLLGGEPTLHPQILEIVEIIRQYTDLNPSCVLEIATNGCGVTVNSVLKKIPEWVSIRNTDKTSIIHDFCSYNIAPIDLREYVGADFTKGCWITTACGLGLTKYGYYSCGAGASVDRVFGFDVGIKKLKDVGNSSLKKQMKIICSYCGHYKKNRNTKRTREEAISPSWSNAYSGYRKQKPALSEY
ncbi:radical SAM protein [Patescibacteria group bacterium]|nr:radical SAM protein [Patescibacteria group bacterium]MBU1870964.1 radical SAM protein [Patescibacteria group bacterium]